MGQCVAGFEKGASEKDLLEACIAELEAKQSQCKVLDIRRKDNIPLQNRLVKLIGNKPLLDCAIGGVKERALLDSGSMISALTSSWVREKVPTASLEPISTFVEDEGEIKFLAANGTEVTMIGCVVLPFCIGGSTFPVPFLVTEADLSSPIVGYNVIEHVIKTGRSEDVIHMLTESIRGVEAGKVEVMVDLIRKKVDGEEDRLGELRTVKPVVVPAKGTARVRCRVKGEVKGADLLFLCSEPCTSDWDDDLIVTESLGELSRGRTPHVNIELRNASGKDKYIGKNMLVGEISAINAVIPLKLFNSSPVDPVEQVGVNSVEKAGVSSEKWQPKAQLDHLPPEQRREIEELLFEECEVFARSDNDIGDIPDFQMDIRLTDEVPVHQAYRHLPRQLYDDVKNYLNDLLVNGWIQESSSPYASPIVCVRKKDNSLRMCVDYRKLNLKTIPDRQPIPRVQDLLDGLHGQRFFTTLDMAKAYHQGYVRDICRKYTAFSTPWQLFEFLRVPFGLKNAPAAFQKYMNTALSGLLDKACLAYLDDILIFGKTFGEQKENLRLVLRRLKSKGIKLRVEKCVFVQPEVQHLGRLVSSEEYRADPEDIKALEKFRVAPKTVGDVRSLMGFLGYYRPYVRDFAKKLKPIYDLLKVEKPKDDGKAGAGKVGVKYDKRREIVWDTKLQALVDDVINTLQSPKVMAYPDFNSPFILHTDASGVGLGAVLYQKQGEEQLNRVVSYASRTLSPAEKKLPSPLGEIGVPRPKMGRNRKIRRLFGAWGKVNHLYGQ